MRCSPGLPPPLPASRAGGQVWADFRELLAAPTGKQDYVLLCTATGALGLSGVPPLAEVDADTRARFAVLVDVAHDTDTRLLLALSGPADWSGLPPRTVSRLSLLRRGAGGRCGG